MSVVFAAQCRLELELVPRLVGVFASAERSMSPPSDELDERVPGGGEGLSATWSIILLQLARSSSVTPIEAAITADLLVTPALASSSRSATDTGA